MKTHEITAWHRAVTKKVPVQDVPARLVADPAFDTFKAMRNWADGRNSNRATLTRANSSTVIFHSSNLSVSTNGKIPSSPGYADRINPLNTEKIFDR